jgi:hypothetical protein
VTEPKLVVVVADADAEAMVRVLVDRGMERRCLDATEYVVRRHPMRDAAVCRNPLSALQGVRPGSTRVLVVFDLHGSGREEDPRDAIERDVVEELERHGFPRGDVGCVVLDPEVETVLVCVWDRVAELLAAKRGESPPPRSAYGVPEENWQSALAADPKGYFLRLLAAMRLRHQSALFGEIARAVSLPALKSGDASARIAGHLVQWFGANP